MKRILLVDDHQMVRNSIKYCFDANDDCEIIAEASNGTEALEVLKNISVDVIITDYSMPSMDGVELVKNLRKQYPEVKTIMLTMHDEAKYIKQALKTGVDGYVLKTGGKDVLIKAVDTVSKGMEYFDERITQVLISDIAKKAAPPMPLSSIPITEREIEVLTLIAQEHTNQEIADKLFISPRTVEAHKSNLLTKTGAKTVAGLVFYAMDKGFV